MDIEHQQSPGGNAVAQDEIQRDHPTTRRKSHSAVLFVSLTSLTLVAVIMGIFVTRSLAAPNPSSHSTAVTLASPTLQCAFTRDYTYLPHTLAELKHASDIIVLGVVTSPANPSSPLPFAEWSVSIISVVYDRHQALASAHTISVRQDDGTGNDGGCRNADDPLLRVGDRAFFFLGDGGSAALTGVSTSGPAPYYHEIFGANCRFPSVNGLVPRNATGLITYDRPPTEASFIAQVRAANP